MMYEEVNIYTSFLRLHQLSVRHPNNPSHDSAAKLVCFRCSFHGRLSPNFSSSHVGRVLRHSYGIHQGGNFCTSHGIHTFNFRGGHSRPHIHIRHVILGWHGRTCLNNRHLLTVIWWHGVYSGTHRNTCIRSHDLLRQHTGLTKVVAISRINGCGGTQTTVLTGTGFSLTKTRNANKGRLNVQIQIFSRRYTQETRKDIDKLPKFILFDQAVLISIRFEECIRTPRNGAWNIICLDYESSSQAWPQE